MHIGTDATRKFIDISEESRKANMAVFGIKNTGKAFTMIPSLFDQDLKEKGRGITIIVDTPELAWYLYGMCKVEGRKVDILKPSISFELLNEFLFNDGWDYEKCKKYYDYEVAIKEKRVTIIDMEEERYGEKAIRANSMLLLQLQAAMTVEYSKKVDYAVYIDGATSYMPYIKNLLKYGDYYGFKTTLFAKSMTQLKENSIFVDDYVRNFILLQGISYEDAKYFGERMELGKDGTKVLMNREYGKFVYEILGDNYQRKMGEGNLLEFTDEKKKEIITKATSAKKRFKEVNTDDHHYQLEKESEALTTDEKTTFLEEVGKEVEKKKREPQLNQKIKTTNIPKKEEVDYSMLDSFETEEIEVVDNLEELPLEEIKLEEPEEFDLTDEKTKFTIGGKNRPYHKIKNKKIERSLEDFKI